MFCSINTAITKNNLVNKVSQLATSNQSFEKVDETTLRKLKNDDTLSNINNLFGEPVIKPQGNLYNISPSEDLINRFIGEEQQKLLQSTNPSTVLLRQNRNEEFSAASPNKDSFYTFLNFPEISELTNDKLVGFLKKLNPDFRIETVEGLSENGQAYIKDFLIRLNNFSGFKAMPEEASHFFVELLPKGSALRNDLLKNITNYDIYSHTYRQYSSNPEYQKDGQPDIDKIKREAAAKLIAEYIYAHSTGDKTRLDAIGKKRESFFQKWMGKFLKWIGMGITDSSHFYADVAAQILAGDVDTSLSERAPEDDLNNSVFFQLTQNELYTNALAIDELKPPRLLEIISNFRREFNDKFISILKDGKFKEINDVLKLDPNDKNSINKLDELSQLLKGINVNTDDMVTAYASVQGIKQFLEVMDRMSILSDAITKIVNRKEDAETFAQAVNNIQELESYMSLYESFNNIISNDLISELIKAHKQLSAEGRKDINIQELVDTINQTKLKFDGANRFIIDNLEGDFFVFYKELLKDTNDNVSQTLLADLQREETKPSPNKEIIKSIKKKINQHVQSDEKILKMLTGKTGTEEDIDPLSNFNHLINASIANGNMYVAGIVKYIQSHTYKADSKTLSEQQELLHKADKLEKAIGEDTYKLGHSLSYVEKQYDPSEDEKSRDVLVFLHQFKGADLDKKLLTEQLREIKKNMPKDKNSEAYKTAVENLATKVKEYNAFIEKYYNRPFTKGYYDYIKEFHDDPEFVMAYDEWETISKEIRNLEGYMNDGIFTDEDYKHLAEKRRQRSILLQETDELGQPKSPADLAKTKLLKDFFDKGSSFKELDVLQSERAFQADKIRYDQRVNSAINEIEKSNTTNIKDVEEQLKTLLKDRRAKIVTPYLQEMEGDPMFSPGDPIDYEVIHNILMEKWENDNRLIIPNQAYYDKVKEVMDELNGLQKKGELSQWDIMLKDLYDERRNLSYGYRDNSNQLNPNNMPQETIDRLNEIENEIEEIKKEKPRDVDTSEFSAADKTLYDKYLGIQTNTSLPTQERYYAKVKARSIINKYNNTTKKKRVRELWSTLAELSVKNPTDYYWDRMDTMMSQFAEYIGEKSSGLDPAGRKILSDYYGDIEERIENKDSDYLDFELFPSEEFGLFLDWLKTSKHAEMHDWFTNSHIEKSEYDVQIEKYVKIPYARNSIYVHKLPTLDQHQEISYNKKHRRTRIKNEFRTGYDNQTGEVNLKVGEHVDNKGEWLPLSVEQGQKDRKYINEDYYKLKNSTDPKQKLKFQYLEMLKEANLAHQELLPKRLRTWMNVPVRELDKYEEKLHMIKNAPDTLKRGFDKAKSIFTKTEAGDAEAQLSGEDTVEDIDQFTKKVITDKIPKMGMMQRMPVQRVSRNLLGATAEYMSHANNFEGRTEAQPIVKALVKLMKNNQMHGANNKQITAIFEKLYSQMILQEVPDSLTNNRTVKRFVKLISASTGLRLLADIPGGLINYGSAQVNNIIEAMANQHMSPRDYLKGNMLAGTLIKDVIADFTKKTNLSYSTLLYQTFDFIQGEFEDDILDRTSLKGKTSSIRDYAMIPRKSGELHAQSAVALGILNKHKVPNTIDGKTYAMHEIYEAKDNKLSLKAGFDPALYNPVDGTEYLAVKKLINRVNMELHGNYAKINQTEASRHGIGKLAENMKRWFATGFSRRWGRELPDISYEGLNEGYYTTFFKALYNVVVKPTMQFNFTSSKDWFNYYTSNPMYRSNLKRAATDFSAWATLYLLYAGIFGYSGDDKDKELANNNWLTNLAILTTLRMYSESNAYMPLPSMGLGELKRNAFSPLSLPMDTFSNAAALGQLSMYQVAYAAGDESLEGDLYYQKDGGYWFTEKGDSKFMKYTLKNFGYNGYTQNPAQYIKDFGKLQGRLK